MQRENSRKKYPLAKLTQLLVANTAETREYRLRFWDKGQANGGWSPMQKVTVGA